MEYLKKRQRNLYILIIPALILFTVFWVLPVIMSFYYGLTDWTGMGDYNFIGLKNFRFLLKDGTLISSFKNTFKYAIFMVIFGNLVSFTIALILNMKLKLKGIFRTAFYIPALFSTIVVGFIWSYVYAPHFGLIAEFMGKIGLLEHAPNFLASPKTALYATAFVDLWRSIGTMTIIYLAGLQGISEDLLEAAQIDGCSSFRTTISIRIPLLANTIIVNIMLGLISGMKAFDYVFTMTHGGPGTSSSTLMYSVYRMAFIDNQFGLAEALAAVAFVVILVISATALALMRRKEVEV